MRRAASPRVCMFFLSEEVGYFAGTALMYLYSGFYAVFLTVMFLDYAPKSGCPELWAGMGRIVRSFTVAATVLPALKVYDAAGSTVLAAGSCLASIGVLLALLPHIGHAVAAWERGRRGFRAEGELAPGKAGAVCPEPRPDPPGDGSAGAALDH